jgi:hypothetical protein
MSYISLLTICRRSNCNPMPQGGMDTIMGHDQTDIFGSGSATAAPSLNLSSIVGMLGVVGMTDDTTGGEGPYKPSYTAFQGLDKHTVY